MGKAKEILERIKQGWQGLSKGEKIGLASILTALIVSIVIYYFAFGKTEYVPAFTHLDIQDSGKIVKKLEEMKITNYKIEEGGQTILVPEKDVDRLRLDLAIDGSLPNSGKGFEIFDDAGFAITEEDRKIMYQRALEGELQRSIMSLNEVDFARVHLVLAEDTIFAKETKAASASIILQLNPMQELKPDQIKGVISLVSGAVKNLPEENVRVIDNQSNLLSDGILEENNSAQGTTNMNQQMEIQNKFEKSLEKDLKTMLEQTLGIGKVLVKVTAKLDFNSMETTSISYDKDGAIVSQQKKLERIDDMSAGLGQSPSDNNMSVVQDDENAILNNAKVNNYETITNYEVGETKTYILKSPGEVKNISTSVIYNGDLTDKMQTSIANIVKAAIGFEVARGDIVNVEGIAFDNSYQEKLQKELAEAETKVIAAEEKRKKITLYSGLGAGAFVLLLLISFGIMKMIANRKRKKEVPAIDVTADEPIYIKEVIEETMEQIAVGNETEAEKSIKHFAEQNPDKMADLLKAWILEDER